MIQNIVSPSRATKQNHYRTGTLSYSGKGLFVLALWLLWGDFAFSFFESIFSRFAPIYLKELQASNTLIGIISGSFAGLVNILFLPGISRWSDNFRSKFGRRIPFLCVVTPLTVGALVAFGFAPEIGSWLHERFSPFLPMTWTESGITLGLLCVFAVCFHFFNMVLVNSYGWLIRDVVPLEVMARFLAWFRFIGTVSTIFFLWFAFPHLVTHRAAIFSSVGLFYLIAFLLMCYKVKEGEYTPPSPVEIKSGAVKMFFLYFRECFHVPIYRNFFIVNLLMTAGLNCAGAFVTLFATEILALDMQDMGHIFSWAAAISAVASLPLGWLCDRLSPLPIALGAIITISLGSILAMIYVGSKSAYLIYALTFSLPYMAWSLSSQTTAMLLFPPMKFGQFSSGLNVFGCGALVVGNMIIGLIMDVAHSNYQMAFLWTSVISVIAIFPMIRVMQDWRRHGGPDHYEAPPLE